mgnify:CR=1 FL=1
MIGKNGYLNIINKKIDKIALNMERFKLVDYVYYLENPRKMFYANFIGGLARGFGAAIGFTVLGAIFIYFLRVVVRMNLPVIGEFISEIVSIVQDHLRRSGGKVGV